MRGPDAMDTNARCFTLAMAWILDKNYWFPHKYLSLGIASSGYEVMGGHQGGLLILK